MHAAVKKQRDELLEFIRRLAEDDKDGVMANKVLNMLWTLAKRDDCLPDTLDHALNAHLKILDFSCAQVSFSLANLQFFPWIYKYASLNRTHTHAHHVGSRQS